MATVICPNCGGENNVTKRGSQECAYCGTMLQYPQAKRKQTKKSEESNNDAFPQAEYIIEIATRYSSDNQVMDELRKFLLNSDNVPLDVFDNLEIREIKWLYLPMIRYSGHVETEWSCNQVIEKKREVGQRPVRDRNGKIKYYETEYETYYDYIPKSGKGYGNFDTLIPCGKGKHLSKGLELCYGRIDFSKISSGNQTEWPCKQFMPDGAIVDTDYIDLNDNKSGIIGAVERVVKSVATDCSYGNFDRTSDPHLSYRWDFNRNTGIVYYIPFVQVLYSYRGTNHEWVFMQSPSIRTAEPTIPEMDESANPLIEMQNKFENQRKRISRKELWSYVISFFLPPWLGLVFFMMFTDKICKQAKRRLNTQLDLATLLFRLKRTKGLSKQGKKAEISNEGIEDLYDDEAGDYDGEEDTLLYDGGVKPSTIEGIEAYFAETEVIYRKAIKRINGYWWRFIAIVLLLGGSIGGYFYYDNWQKEKMWEEEYAIREAENKKLAEEVTKKFKAEMIGTTYEGAYLGSFMQIKILENSRLQYKLGEETSEWDENYRHKIRWGNPKTISYKLDIGLGKDDYWNETKEFCFLEFDGYKTSNLVNENGDNFFVDSFTIPRDKNQSGPIYTDSFHLRKVNEK